MEGADVQVHSRKAQEGPAVGSSTAAESPVLVAVEFSPESEAALVWAWNYAKAVGAPLEVLHVVHDPADSPGTYKPSNGDSLQPMADVAQDLLADFLERAGRDHPDLADLEAAKTMCSTGLPAATILRVAEAHRVRHIILGSQRRTSLARLFRGSTANQVVSNAKVPVTIVKANG